MAATIAVPRVETKSAPSNIFQLIPGILLLAAVGFAGKFLEKYLNTTAKAHHWTFPNIEYVLWAIVIGLVLSFVLLLLFDRRHVVELDASKSFIEPNPVSAGERISITWSAISRRNCAGFVIPRILESSGIPIIEMDSFATFRGIVDYAPLLGFRNVTDAYLPVMDR